MASVAALVAVAGASAVGQVAQARPRTSASAFTSSPPVVEQANGLADDQNDTNAALAQARRAAVQRNSAFTQKLNARAAALTRSRVLAAGRVARARVRQGLLARAQSDPMAAGRLLAAERGWGDAQFDCLKSLWTKESGWRWNANNSSSGAYGIPQSLPGSKMSSFGSDWATNPITQIKWGLQYISNSYGTPCSAWGQSQASNWY